jgi:putative SOS response-associated peptidase YedK
MRLRPPTGEMVRSFTIVTTDPNGQMEPIHNRMPVILPPAAWPRWLGEEGEDLDAAQQQLIPYSEHLVMWPVHGDVGNVKNNHAALVQPIAR